MTIAFVHELTTMIIVVGVTLLLSLSLSPSSMSWKSDAPLVDPLIQDVTPAASNVLGILYFGCLYGLTGHLQVHQ